MALYTHAPDPQGKWENAQGGRFHIFSYDDEIGGDGAFAFFAGKGQTQNIRVKPWLKADSAFDYSLLVGLTSRGMLGSASQIHFNDNLSPANLGGDNVQDAIDSLDREVDAIRQIVGEDLLDTGYQAGNFPGNVIDPTGAGGSGQKLIDALSALELGTGRSVRDVDADGETGDVGYTHFINTSPTGSNGPAGFTLPASPANGAVVRIMDPYGTFGDSPVTVDGNGATVEGDPSKDFNTPYGSYELVYNEATNGWIVQEEGDGVTKGSTTTSDATETAVVCIPVPADSAVGYDINIVAYESTGLSGYWSVKGLSKNVGGTLSDVGGIYEIVVAREDASWAIDVCSNGSCVEVKVTGAAGQSIKWSVEAKTYSA